MGNFDTQRTIHKKRVILHIIITVLYHTEKLSKLAWDPCVNVTQRIKVTPIDYILIIFIEKQNQKYQYFKTIDDYYYD